MDVIMWEKTRDFAQVFLHCVENIVLARSSLASSLCGYFCGLPPTHSSPAIHFLASIILHKIGASLYIHIFSNKREPKKKMSHNKWYMTLSNEVTKITCSHKWRNEEICIAQFIRDTKVNKLLVRPWSSMRIIGIID